MTKQVDFFLKHYDIASYKAAYRAIASCKEVCFYLEDITSYGGILMAIVDGKEYQVTKKKVRFSDFEALKKGYYFHYAN